MHLAEIYRKPDPTLPITAEEQQVDLLGLI